MTKTKRMQAIIVQACLAAGLFSACTEVEIAPIGSAYIGDPCHQLSECQAGLTCESSQCVEMPPLATGPQRGDACTTDTDCGATLFCGTQDVCARTAGADAGAPCGLSLDCKQGLVCHGDSLTCVNPAGVTDGKGVKDLSAPCTSFTDCRRPYLCAIADTSGPTCEKIPFFPGPDCTRTEEEVGAFRVYYEIPPADPEAETRLEFYRLPFPNDIRLIDGRISLAGHPSPGEVMGIDVAGEYIRSIESDADGFALNGPVFFRLTDFPRRSSICLDVGGSYPATEAGDPFCPDAGAATVYLVNIDPTSAGYNQHIPVQVDLDQERGQYICQNFIGLAPQSGRPLAPNTTYAAVLTTGLRDIRNDPPVPDLDFVRILTADNTLTEQELSATAPLLTWIDDQGIDSSELAAATVFTTGNPARVGAELYQVIQDLPAPAFNADAFSCDDAPAQAPPCHGLLAAGTTIPERSCASHANFVEIHGSYDGPVFQEGMRPYPTSDQGGQLSRHDVSGLPEPVRNETMCYALTIPTVPTMPANGWPVMIYAHGTNGNYRSFTGKTVTEDFTSLGFAVIGIDNVMHGPRQDPSPSSATWLADLWNLAEPGSLYFNVINARAGRDNTLQGAADLFFLTRLLHSDAPVVANMDIAFDPGQIYFLGHSQGTTIASPYLAHETGIQAAIFSGAGAELSLSLLNKTKPVNVAEMIGTLFGDPDMSRIHPMMGLLAILFGPADSVAFADQIVVNPPRLALPFLMFSGLGDNFTPYPTQEALIRAMKIPLVAPIEQAIDGVSEVNPPLTDTAIDGVASGVAAAALQYRPQNGGTGSDDGHFVLFNYENARQALRHFLTTTQAGSPEIDR